MRLGGQSARPGRRVGVDLVGMADDFREEIAPAYPGGPQDRSSFAVMSCRIVALLEPGKEKAPRDLDNHRGRARYP